MELPPEEFWEKIQYQKPYSRTTTLYNVSAFYDWLEEAGYRDRGTNPYKEFRKNMRRVLQGSYVEKIPEITFEQAEKKCKAIPEKEHRVRALQLLYTGMRVSEPQTLKDGFVVGKGNKVRRVHTGKWDRTDYSAPYWKFHEVLVKNTGLKPHDLRKIFAMRLVQKGIDPLALCQVMGWSDPRTALKYVKHGDESMGDFVAGAVGGE